METEQMHTFASGAKRSELKPRYDLIPSVALEALARRYALGAERYGEYNWQKGLPFNDVFNHMQDHMEHFKQWVLEPLAAAEHPGRREDLQKIIATDIQDGEIDNDLAAIMWGCATLLWYLHERVVP